MLELLLCSSLTILPDFLYRRYAQGKRLGKEITLFTVWYELRWGITLCVLLTVSLITVIFYYHPSTMAAKSVFRTVTILPETNGRVAETYVDINSTVKEGDPLFRLDSASQEAAVEAAKRSIDEIDAQLRVATAQLKEADARIVQARGNYQQAFDEYETRQELYDRNPDTVSKREVDRARVRVDTEQGIVDGALAAREVLQTTIDFELPARKAHAEATLHEAQVELDKTLVVAGTDGVVQQFALRPGDIVNPMLRPAGILVPERKVTGLAAGFGQIESEVIKLGMIGEVACIAKPWKVIPMVVTEIQNVIAGGQIRPTDQLVDIQSVTTVGSITVIMEPLYPGELDSLPQGASCIANLYTSNHDLIEDESTGSTKRFLLHAVDAVGLIHAAILRIQALMMPVQILVFKGH